MANNEYHDTFKSDFGFTGPVRGGICKIPAFADLRLHRIALMKDKHIGSTGDCDEVGTPGWISKYVCVGCGKKFKVNGFSGMFHVDRS
jgi:hypothetical protein